MTLRLALTTALVLSPGAVLAQGATAAAPTTVVSAAPAAGTMITIAQASAVIAQMGFTPVGTPVLKGTVIGSLARLGNNAFIVTVDAMTGKFIDAKPTDMPLPPAMMTAPAPASATTTPTTPAPTTPTVMATTTPPTVAATTRPSPVMAAANLARAKGFKVLSFKHQGDDTFLVGQKGNALFQLKVSDKGVLLAVTPMQTRAQTQTQTQMQEKKDRD